MSLLRVYTPEECGRDGYPFVWHRCDECNGEGTRGDHYCEPCEGAGSVKNMIRQRAGHRCIRCGHPYKPGDGEWVEADGDGELASTPLFDNLSLADFPDRRPREVQATRAVLWSPCDDRCTHDGPLRVFDGEQWQASPYVDNFTPAHIFDASEYEQVQAAWRILTVHHLDERKANLRWWNLTSLCQRCHLNVQRRVKLERPWATEHSEWFKPYAAGWYAHRYLNREVTREALENVEGLMDELLAIEHVQHRLEGLE